VAAATAGGDLIDAHALGTRAVEVPELAVAEAPTALDEPAAQRVRRPRHVGDVDGPAGAVVVVRPAAIVLQPSEIGQHVAITPAGVAERAPLIEVARQAADVDHGVDRAGASHDLAAWPEAPAARELRIRLCLVHPVDTRIVEGAAVADRQL